MTVALSVVLAVAVVAAAFFGWIARRGSVVLRREQARLVRQSNRLRDAEERAAKAEERATSAEERATKAEEQVARTDEQLEVVRRHVDVEVEKSLEAHRLGRSATGAVPPGVVAGAPSVDAMLALERVRLDREWLEVAGPGVELPASWDGSLAAGVAIELAVIREVIGTPSEMSVTSSRPHRNPVALRVTCELLRALARSGDEMYVEISDQEIVVSQDQDHIPDLADLQEAAEHSGMALSAGLDGTKVSTKLTFYAA